MDDGSEKVRAAKEIVPVTPIATAHPSYGWQTVMRRARGTSKRYTEPTVAYSNSYLALVEEGVEEGELNEVGDPTSGSPYLT